MNALIFFDFELIPSKLVLKLLFFVSVFLRIDVMPAHSKLDNEATFKQWDQYRAMSEEFRGVSVADNTRNQYERLTNEFIGFCEKFKIEEKDLLPLQTEHIEAWFSHLFDTRPMRWESFCKRVAALRSFSRRAGHFSVDHLNYNVQKSKSAFCSFMGGLRRKLDRIPRKKAHAVTAELLTYVLDDILKHEINGYLKMRDVIILSLCFLLGLRAVDVSVVNTDGISMFPNLRSGLSTFKVVVLGGKQTKDQANVYEVCNSSVAFDIFNTMSVFLSETNKMYDQSILKPDALGRKLFVNIDQKTFLPRDKRVSTNTITKILKTRIGDFYRRTNASLTNDEIDNIVAPYSSHSLKRGGITDAAIKGANERELQVMFKFKNTKTPQEYVDQTILQSLGQTKRPVLKVNNAPLPGAHAISQINPPPQFAINNADPFPSDLPDIVDFDDKPSFQQMLNDSLKSDNTQNQERKEIENLGSLLGNYPSVAKSLHFQGVVCPQDSPYCDIIPTPTCANYKKRTYSQYAEI